MQEEFEYFHRLTLLCRSVSYSAESIIQLISITRFPCNHRLPPEQPLQIIGRRSACPDNPSATSIEQETDKTNNGQNACSLEENHDGEAKDPFELFWRQSDFGLNQKPTTINQETSDEGQSGFFPCKQCSNKQREHRMYLVGQLLDAVEAGDIDLWDSELAKKQRLPGNRTLPNFNDTFFNNDVVRWMLSGTLTNEDLIKFCRSEKIQVVFKYDPSVDHGTKQEPTNTTPEPAAVLSPVVTNSLPLTKPPGKMPNVAIGKLAIEVAWEIECRTKRKASASEVIARMKEMAKNNEHDILINAPSRDLIWITSTLIEKKYSLEACSKALKTWHKSRPQDGS